MKQYAYAFVLESVAPLCSFGLLLPKPDLPFGMSGVLGKAD